jgi:hypothetical protein
VSKVQDPDEGGEGAHISQATKVDMPAMHQSEDAKAEVEVGLLFCCPSLPRFRCGSPDARVYISIATYLVKLIPLYGGYTAGRSTLREILQWYVSSGAKFTNILSTISLAPPDIIFIETALETGVAITLGFRLTAWLFDSPVAS